MNRILILLLAIPLCSCVDFVKRNSNAEKAAENFSSAADDCLLDVRDREIPYAESYNCTTRLSKASSAYTNLPVKLFYNDETPPRHAYIAESAKSVAWSAAALSNGKFPNLEAITSLW